MPISPGTDRIRRALELAHPASRETFYDLGCGHRRALCRAGVRLHAVGVEVGSLQRAVSR